MNLPCSGWVITCAYCDNPPQSQEPNPLFYTDLDWACHDAKERNKDHAGHKVVAVDLTKRDEEKINLWHDKKKVAHACICTKKKEKSK